MSNASWTPDESASVLFDEKTWLQGAILTGVGYGIVFTLFCMTIRALVISINSMNYKKRVVFLVYTTAMFLLGSIFMGACAEMTQLSFIQYRNSPGGPSEYENVEFSVPADEAGNVAFVLTNWFADGLMVWRCIVIYKGCRVPLWIACAFPSLMYLAEFALGLLWLIQISTPESSPYLAAGVNWTIPYLSIAVATNVLVTLMIVGRLLLQRRRITVVLGGGHGSQYISLATMLVESAAIYSSFALLFIIPFAIGNPIANTFLQALSEVQIIAPFLIIYRVARGRAWSANTNQATLSTFKVNTPITMSTLSGTGNISGRSHTTGGQPRVIQNDTSSAETDMKIPRVETMETAHNIFRRDEIEESHNGEQIYSRKVHDLVDTV